MKKILLLILLLSIILLVISHYPKQKEVEQVKIPVKEVVSQKYYDEMFKYQPGEIFTKDILNKDNHKLFKITIESLPRMIKQSRKNPRAVLLENGNVLIWNDIVQLYDTKKKKFNSNFKLGDQIDKKIYLGRENFIYPHFYTDRYYKKLGNNKILFWSQVVYDGNKNEFIYPTQKAKDLHRKAVNEFIKARKYKGKCKLIEQTDRFDFCQATCPGEEHKICQVWVEDTIDIKRSAYGTLKNKMHSFEPLMLPDKNILLIGGFDKEHKDSLKAIQLYNTQTGEIKELGKINSHLYYTISVLIDNKNVLIFGNSEDIDGHRLFKAELFNIQTGNSKSVNIQKQPYHKEKATITLLDNGKVLIFGDIAYLYNPKTNQLYDIEINEFETGRNKPVIKYLNNGQTLIAGGNRPKFSEWEFKGPGSIDTYNNGETRYFPCSLISAELLTIKDY